MAKIQQSLQNKNSQELRMFENGSESNTQNPGLLKEDALGTIQDLCEMPAQGIFWLGAREAVASARHNLASVLM